MRNKSKILALVALTTALIASPVVNAAPNVTTTPATGQATIRNTTVKIVKLGSSEWAPEVGVNGITNADGVALRDDQIATLGANVQKIAGVQFKYFKVANTVTKEQLDAAVAAAKAAGKTLETYIKENKATYGIAGADNGTALPNTNTAGETTWTWNVPATADKTETYWVIETAAPNTVSEGRAVPFQITFPMSASNGSGYLTNVTIYPKNDTANLPQVGKDVGALGRNFTGVNAGDNLSFFLKGTIPTNIENYEQYEFSDLLDEKLQYVAVPEVKFGTKTLTLTTHYTVNKTEVGGKDKVVVALTPAGIAHIAQNIQKANRGSASSTIANEKNNTDAAPFIQVKLDAKVKADVVAGKAIVNEAEITFDNTPDKVSNPKPSSKSDKVVVAAGGKRFVKQEQGTATQLEGAEFTVHADKASAALNWTAELIAANKAAIDAGKFIGANGQASSAANVPTVGSEIRLRSTANGEFEINGLAFGGTSEEADALAYFNTASTKYFIKEVKAPEGYVVPAEAFFEFTVERTSYYQDPTAVALTAAANLAINNNKRPVIPATGGIGSIIFVVVGAGIMFAGYKFTRKEAK